MKKILVAILLLSIAQTLSAQREGNIGFAIIDDKDGFTNIRLKPNSKSKVIGKIKDGELFYCLSDDTKNEWIPIDFNDTLSGYIHKSRVKFLKELPFLKYREIFNYYTIFKNDSIKITITAEDFEPNRHQITKKNGFVTLIDGKKPWGIDGGLPYTGIKEIKIQINDYVFDLPKDELIDLFHPSFEELHVYVSKDSLIFITMSNSDGAGAYELGFVIKDRSLLKRYIYHGF